MRDLAFRVTGNRIPFAVLLLIVAFLASTAWYTHRTLVRRADIERTYRDLEYQRTPRRGASDDVAIMTIAFLPRA